MATPPVQIAGSPWQSSWTSSTTPKLAPTAGNFAAGVGDLIVVESITENGQTLATPTNAAASPATITWTLKQNIGTAGATCRAASWTGVVTVAGNVQVSVARTSVSGGATDLFGIIVWAFNSHGGVGQTPGNNNTVSSAPSLAPASPWSANSMVCCADGDWAAGATAGATYRTNLGTATQAVASNTDGNYTVYAWHHADAGASPGSGAVGMTAPNQAWSLVAVEVLGTGAAATSLVIPRSPLRGLIGR